MAVYFSSARVLFKMSGAWIPYQEQCSDKDNEQVYQQGSTALIRVQLTVGMISFTLAVARRASPLC